MFTGIITHVSVVTKKTDTDLQISGSSDLLSKLDKGTSIAVDGICLTVVSKNKNSFTVNFMPETAKKTNIQYLTRGTEVNLELPATIDTLFSGHIVQGHVDTVGEITDIKEDGNSRLFTFTIPQTLTKYIVEKGSIAINGISLTVISVTKIHCIIGIIPHTWNHTMLHSAKIGDMVNIEIDALAKYVEKLIQNK